jgi:prophage regulatory protein
MSDDRLMRLPEVSKMVGMCRTTIYKYVKTGEFPKPIWFGQGRLTLWSHQALQDWMASLKTPSSGEGGGVGERV